MPSHVTSRRGLLAQRDIQDAHDKEATPLEITHLRHPNTVPSAAARLEEHVDLEVGEARREAELAELAEPKPARRRCAFK